MILLTLPSGDRRTALRSFWLLISIIFGVGVWFVISLFKLPFASALGVIGTVAFGLLVFAQEKLVRRLYHAWNRRLVLPLAEIISDVVMATCLFIIFAATGKRGSRLRLDPHASTTWEPRASLPSDSYELPFPGRGKLSTTGWIRSYLRWAIRSGNMWSISLIPFLYILRSLSSDQQKAVEANIYTLF